MKLENQVVNLELAKRLKELGVKQESYFRWIKAEKQREKCPDCTKVGGLIPECFYCGGTGKGAMLQNYRLYPTKECLTDNRGLGVSAFTVAELEKMMPSGVNVPYKNGKPRDAVHYLLFGRTGNSQYNVRYVNRRYDSDSYMEGRADTLADAFAKMLIYLLENGLHTLAAIQDGANLST